MDTTRGSRPLVFKRSRACRRARPEPREWGPVNNNSTPRAVVWRGPEPRGWDRQTPRAVRMARARAAGVGPPDTPRRPMARARAAGVGPPDTPRRLMARARAAGVGPRGPKKRVAQAAQRVTPRHTCPLTIWFSINKLADGPSLAIPCRHEAPRPPRRHRTPAARAVGRARPGNHPARRNPDRVGTGVGPRPLAAQSRACRTTSSS